MARGVARYLRVYAACVKMSLNQAMIYPVSFLSQVAGHLASIGLGVLFFASIYLAGAPLIAGWTLPQVMLLLATNNLVAWVDAFFFGSNVGRVPLLVRTGALDYFLLKPLNPRFLLSVQQANLTALMSLLAQVPLFAYAWGALGLGPGSGRLAMYLVLVAAGAVVRHSLSFMAATFAFWWTESSSLQAMVAELLDLAGYPEGIYRKGVRAVLTYVVPVAILANWPARALQGLLTPQACLAALGVACGFFLASGALWRASVRRYTGASG
ncbi:MAG: ABC-2 family transporter protein [Acetobacteraceae bacterium]|nr:ABC-2 family transporter protein [Acetobacteraceae bacterium]